MSAITITAVVGPDHKLVIDVPGEIPPGPVSVVIQPVAQGGEPARELTRAEARARLLAAGKLVTDIHAPEGTVSLSPHELLKVGRMPEGTRPSEELIDEDRGEH